jgi:hypothetical protein
MSVARKPKQTPTLALCRGSPVQQFERVARQLGMIAIARRCIATASARHPAVLKRQEIEFQCRASHRVAGDLATA